MFNVRNPLKHKRGLVLTHLNVRSLWPHIDDIRNCLYETVASCFTISETWLHNMISDDMVSVPGYTIYLHDRQTVRVNFFFFFFFLLINSSLYSAFHEPYDMV